MTSQPVSVTKAVIPTAGLGTRFLPATKAMPKEMLPVVDRPLIQHVVDEARQAGIEHLIFVTGRNKSVIEDHFDRQFELELTLTERGKKAELSLLSKDLPEAGTISYTRQQSPLGLGHAVWCARELVGHEPFALLLPDVLVQHPRGCLIQMIDAAKDLDGNANIIAVEEVPADACICTRGRRRRCKGKDILDYQNGRKAKGWRSAFQSFHHRTLYLAAADLRAARKAGGGRRR
jgi:UTP--glucose-1-phosphate uridylyltransferase